MQPVLVPQNVVFLGHINVPELGVSIDVPCYDCVSLGVLVDYNGDVPRASNANVLDGVLLGLPNWNVEVDVILLELPVKVVHLNAVLVPHDGKLVVQLATSGHVVLAVLVLDWDPLVPVRSQHQVFLFFDHQAKLLLDFGHLDELTLIVR